MTAAFHRRVSGELQDDLSGDQLDLMNGEEGPNNNPFRSRRFQL